MVMMKSAAANDNCRVRKPCERDALVDALTRAAGELLDERLPFAALEETLLAATNEAVRRVLETSLQRRADSLPERVSVDGTMYRRHLEGGARYYSLCGPLDVRRPTYRLAHGRNGPTVVPIEVDAGLIYRCTPALARALADGHANKPVRAVARDLCVAGRRPPSVSTIHRICTMLGAEIRGIVAHVEPVVRAKEQLPRGAAAINIGLDRTTIPMEEPDEKSRGDRPRVCVRYRMAYVGTVCITDRDGEQLEARRYAVAGHEGPRHVIERMMADVTHAFAQGPRLKLGVVQDGAAEMWNLMRDALRSTPATRHRRWHETVDYYHLSARISATLEQIHPRDQAARDALRARWVCFLETDAGAVWQIAEEMRVLARESGNPQARALAGDFFLYIGNGTQFQYASLPRSLHRGSGVTEGGCKSLITTRAKRSGQRWRRRGITGVLALRSLAASDRLDAFWSLYTPRFTSTVRAVA